MTQEERRVALIQFLLDERQEKNIPLPNSEAEQKRLLRGLMNVRPPHPVGQEFLQLQDEYLQEELRRRGVRAPLAFLAHTTAYAYEAFRVDAMQYLHIPFRPEQLTALLDRATEPEYGPVIPVTTAMGLRALPFADIEYLECTHHVVHFHLLSGEDVVSLSLRVSFAEVAKPLLEDGRFLQPHRSYVVNLAAAQLLTAGELQMCSGARIPIPRGREGAVREAFRSWIDR